MIKNRTRVAMLAIASVVTTEVSWGFKPWIHFRMCKDRLATMSAVADGETISFGESALNQIAWANALTDAPPSYSIPINHFTDERFIGSSARLFLLRRAIVNSLTADPPRGFEARLLLGTAIHTVQDFYAHSNWVEMGNGGINDALGRSFMSPPSPANHTCPENSGTLGPGGGGSLTTGYFLGTFGCDPIPIPGKCFHGTGIPLVGCDGIHKDSDSRPNFDAAHAIASEATEDYVQQILDAIAGNGKAIRALMRNGSVGFVIDDTGSMEEDINGVRVIVAGIIAALELIPTLEPDNWVLERFGDPDVGPPFVTDSAIALLAGVGSLTPHGGGDCPERSQSGLLEAIDAADSNSRLYCFSDASAKDSALRNSVISRAQEKGTTISYVLTGSCSPIDDAYIRGADETGGQLFFINRSEVQLLLGLIGPQLSGDLARIRSHKGTLTNEQRTFQFPVDSTVNQLQVSVSVASKTGVTVHRPSGEPVTESDPDATITSLVSGLITTIEAPQSGMWQVDVTGSGTFSVVVNGNSTLQLASFGFVELLNAVHSGYFPKPGQPVVGRDTIGRATLLGPFATASLVLVDAGGQEIGPTELSQGVEDAVPTDFVGHLSLPPVPFRLLARGTDNNGVVYEREFPAIFRGQTVAVGVSSDNAITLPPGESAQLTFTVDNLGPAGTFRIDAVDTLGAVTGVDPAEISLAANTSGTVAVHVTVPVDAENESVLAVTATATRVDDSTVFNSAVSNVIVRAIVLDPIVKSITPVGGNVAGGYGAVISGSQFGADAFVLWDGVAIAATVADTGETISVIVPPGTFGHATAVDVINLGSSNSGRTVFFYDAAAGPQGPIGPSGSQGEPGPAGSPGEDQTGRETPVIYTQDTVTTCGTGGVGGCGSLGLNAFTLTMCSIGAMKFGYRRSSRRHEKDIM